jgi:fructan beta-fructosidase
MLIRMRPLFHFTAPQNWLNDPNGLVWHDGLWHLCYQHNPHGPEWGHLHWGHAVSRDLLAWEHWPHALSEDPASDFMPYSGSLVATRADGRAPGRERLAALFTGHRGGRAPHWHEHVDLAWSDDGGRTFIRAAHNPVLRGTAQKFGDPKVWWDERHGSWFMANIAGWPEGGHVVFARSSDLATWTICGEFRTNDQPEAVWECPDFFTLPLDDGGSVDVLKVNRWVLATSERTVRYYTGRFDGATFHADGPSQRGPTPLGDESYAEMSWDQVPAADGRRIVQGWLPQVPHPSRPYTGVLWLPRELSGQRDRRDRVVLRYQPVRELETRRRDARIFCAQDLSSPSCLSIDRASGVSEWRLSLDVAEGAWVRLRFSPELSLVADGKQRELRLEKPWKPARAPWDPGAGPLELRLVLDHTAIDVFAHGGTFATAAVTNKSPCDGNLHFEVEGRVRLNQATGWRLA